MTHRRPLPLLLAAGLLTGGLVATASPAVADPDPEPATQDLVLVDTATARSVTGSWTATPTTTMYGTLEVLVTSGAARCTQAGATITFAYAGEDACTVTVQALGDSTHAPSNTVSVTFDVAGHTTATTLAPVPADPAEHVVGDEIDLVATVSTTGHGAPDGTLTIVALGPDDTLTTDDTVIGTPDQTLTAVTDHPDRGTATVQVTPDDAETTDYAARYTPATPSVLAPSTGTYSLSSLWTTETTLTTDPVPGTTVPKVGHPVVLEAEVTSDGHGDPTGTVQFVALGPDDTISSDDEPVGTAQTLTPKAGSSDTRTASVILRPEGVAEVEYAARYDPTSATHARSASDPVAVAAVLRDVDVTIDVDPVVDAGDTAEVTVTVVDLDPSDLDVAPFAVAPGTATTVTVDDELVDPADIDWTDDVTFTVPTSGAALHEIEVAFVPADGDTYATPAVELASFRSKLTQTPTVVPDEAAPYLAGGLVTPKFTGAHGTRTYTPLTTGICTMESGKVRLVKAGACKVDVDLAGDDTYKPGEAQLSFTVEPRPVTVTVTAAPQTTKYGPGILISAVAKDGSTVLAGTGKITITRAEGSTSADGLTPALDYDYSGSPVSFVPPRSGTYEITVSFTPTLALTDIVDTGEGDAEAVVTRADETVTITAPEPDDPDFVPYVGYVWTDVAASSVAGRTPVITATDTDPDVVVCEVGDDLASVVLLAPGNCDVHAYVLQDDRYVGDVDDLTVTVHPRPVTVAVTEVTTPDDDAYDDADDLPRYGEKVVVEVTATDTISGTEPVSGPGVIAVLRPDGTTLDTETVTFVDGVAEIDAVPDALAEHDVVVTLAPDQVHDADADQDVDRYETITMPRTAGTLDVQLGRQRITLDVAAPDPAYVDEDWTIEATGGGSDLEIEASSTSAACAVDGLVVTFRAAATRSCVIDLHQDGDEEFYEPGDAQVTVEVSPRPVTVEVTWPTTDPARVLRYRTPFTVVVTARDDLTGDPVAGTGDGELSLGTQTATLGFVAGVATIPAFTPNQVGVDLDVSATFDATREFAYTAVPDPDGEKITIAKATQTIVYTDPDASYNVDDLWDPEAEGGDSGEPVELTIVDEDGDPIVSEVCEVVTDADEATPGRQPAVLFLAVGSCRVALSQDGDDTFYEPATTRYASTGVVLLSVTLDVTAPPTTTTYADEAALEVESTSTRHVGTVAPGTLGVRVVDVTSGCAVYDDLPALADAPPTVPDWSGARDCATVLVPEVDASVSGGTLTVTFAAQTLLEGDYHVTVGYDGGPDSEYAATRTTTTFHVKPGKQTLSAPQTSYTGYASTEVSPDFQRSRPAAVLTLEVSDLSQLTSLDDYARAEAAAIARGTTYTRPSAPCTVLDDDIELVAKGTCVVTALLEGVTRKWAASDPVTVTTVVSRIPVTLTVTRSSAPAVGKEARLTAQASYLHPVTDVKSAPVGSGPLTVTGVGGDTRTDQAWLGGGRSYAFVPEHATGYGYVADFLPFHPETFASARVTGTITPGKGTQVLGGYDVSALPTTAKVGQADWRPTGTGGRFGNVVRVKVVGGGAFCSVAPAVPAVASDPAADALSFDGAGTCDYRLHLAGNGDWNPVESPTYSIAVSQTDADLGLDVPTLTYDTDTTIRATATVADAPHGFVPGEGTITVTVDGEEADSETVTNSADGMALTFRPDHVSTVVSVTVEFEPDDTAAYAIAADRTVTTRIHPRTQTVALADHDGSAWAGDTWDTDVTASAAPDTVPVVAGSCAPDDDGVVTFRTPGTCRVTADLAAVDENDDGIDEWESAHDEQDVVVSLNETRTVLTVDDERVLNEDIAVSVQVTGRRGDNGVWGGVAGTVQFFVDGEAYGDPVGVDPGGFASTTVQAAPDDDPDWADDWAGGAVPTHAFWATFTPAPVVGDAIQLWATSTSPRQDLAVARRTQTLSNEPSPPRELPVGAVWTPRPTSTSGLDVDTVRDEEGGDDEACSVVDNRVTVLEASTSDTPLECLVTYVQAGDAEWAPVTSGGPTHAVETTARGTTLTLSPVPVTTGTDAAVGSSFTVTATVALVGHALDPSPRPTVPDLGLDGTVTFTVGGTTYERDLDPATGTASVRLEPDTAESLVVTAVFAPDRGRILARSERTATYAVDRAPSTTARPTITTNTITTTVSPVEGREARSAPSGTVTFSYVAGGTTYPLETVDLVGRVATTSKLPPARLAATVVARYDGDRDHLPSTEQRLRDVPSLTPTVVGSTTRWNTGPVRITFRCEPTTGVLVTDCPGAVTLSRDGTDQTVTRTIRAADGGTAVVTTDPVDIDGTGPTVTIAGTSDGAWYQGSAPDAACRASDAVAGIASCVVTRSKTGARTFTDTAVAVDRAGNRSSVRAAFEVRAEWVAGAPLAGGSFQVKPGAKVRVVTRTRGDQPQLMVPVSGGGGKMKASSLFTASQIDDGIITWSATLQLPKKIKVGTTYTVGYRVTGAGAITKLTMKVVRKPTGRQARRGR